VVGPGETLGSPWATQFFHSCSLFFFSITRVCHGDSFDGFFYSVLLKEFAGEGLVNGGLHAMKQMVWFHRSGIVQATLSAAECICM
jgi:hypothetical protein